MLQVRTYPKLSRRRDLLPFLYALFGGIAAVATFTLLDDRLTAAGVSFVLLLPFIYSLLKTGRQRDAHVCLECQSPLPPSLQNSMEYGEPILHHCEKCEILWFVGSTSSY
jgi:hypothetical protein